MYIGPNSADSYSLHVPIYLIKSFGNWFSNNPQYYNAGTLTYGNILTLTQSVMLLYNDA